MSRTTQEWEALLEGTTPGPWRWYWGNGIISVESVDTMPVATDLNVRDSDVLAAAPEAVDEVIRLRWELETWRMRIEKGRDAFKNSRHANRCDKLIATITRILGQEEK